MQMCHHHTISTAKWWCCCGKVQPDDDDDGSRRTQSNCLRPRGEARKKKSLEVWSSPDDKLFSLGPEQTNKLSCFHCRLQRNAGHTAHKNMVIFVSYRHQGLIPTTPPSSCNGKSLIWGEAASEGDFQPPIIQPSIRCDCAEQTEHKTITDDRRSSVRFRAMFNQFCFGSSVLVLIRPTNEFAVMRFGHRADTDLYRC